MYTATLASSLVVVEQRLLHLLHLLSLSLSLSLSLLLSLLLPFCFLEDLPCSFLTLRVYSS